MLIAETHGSLVLRVGTQNVHINSAYVSNMWISALVRSGCPECY